MYGLLSVNESCAGLDNAEQLPRPRKPRIHHKKNEGWRRCDVFGWWTKARKFFVVLFPRLNHRMHFLTRSRGCVSFPSGIFSLHVSAFMVKGPHLQEGLHAVASNVWYATMGFLCPFDKDCAIFCLVIAQTLDELLFHNVQQITCS